MELPELLRSLDLQTFIAFDFETTGLDPSKDKIIEFAAVRFKNGEIEDRYTTLVNPQIPIPSAITNLTSITDEMVKDSPIEKDIIGNIIEFLGNDPLVAHNVDFDYRFLRELKMKYLPTDQVNISNPLYDTLILAQSLLYFLPNHRLQTVTEYFELSSEGVHRALADTVNVGSIFLKLVEEICSYPLSVIQKIITTLQRFDVPNKELYVNIANSLLSSQYLDRGLVSSNIEKPQPNNVYEWKGSISTLPHSAQEVLGEGGLFAFSLQSNGKEGQRFEVRPTQIDFSDFVLQTLEEGDIGIAEAGTGLGKSLAYLYPALKTALQKEEGPTIISCYTKHLQDQLFYQELPKIAKALDISFKATLMKGRRNYLCKTRLDWIIADANNILNSYEVQHLLPVIVWSQWTKTGDFAECPGFLNRRPGRVKSMICSEIGFCSRQTCQKYRGCYIGPLRNESQSANLMVINHALLLSELTNPGVLPPFRRVIIDEAHNLIKVGYNHFQITLNHRVVRESLNVVNPKSRASLRLKGQIDFIGQTYSKIGSLYSQFQNQVETILEKSSHFFELLAKNKTHYFDKNVPYTTKIRYKHFENEFSNLEILITDLISGIKVGIDRLSMLLKELGGLEESKVPQDVFVRLNNVSDSLNEILEVLIKTSLKEKDDWVYWYEGQFVNGTLAISLNAVPVDVGNELYDHVFKPLHSVICTSATLKTGGGFDYFLSRFGLLGKTEKEVKTRDFPSPFHYNEQCNYYQWIGNISPKSDNFPEFIVDTVAHLQNKWKKRILVLFTSKDLIEKCYREFIKRGLSRKFNLFTQLWQTSRTSLLSGFRNSRDGILLGTDSFWQGIDLPEDLLEVLIITKLPFDVPDDPVIEAFSELIAERGGNPFLEFNVPEAVIRLRQGFGRLIRSSYDEGVFLNLDNRVVKKRYGVYFSQAIPVEMMEFSAIENF